ncbi:type II toxin-antitoxin system RatA family toxin [Parvibaculum sedimenti]|uniref:Type II toxin-antitoxin system RatA family toxin n=1 Tax=Parvibaculum sedimenti TaxID=2608632 RepID=A0A6N6VK89_9HYPH|nr:type II toxin-antitoxin system RatA family toxin [Parvibaculum sedimenti]KAB7739350.1 type II toxin-antitoxin system RatA family toxin [Parvibaculum sedimenti]
MPTTNQTQDVPYGADEMFALVAEIERYPEFLPWCAGARIRKRERAGDKEIVTADLIVAYKVFREQFTSRVTLDPKARKVDVEYVQGPFKNLVNKWEFEPLPDGGSCIHFFIDFEFRSATLQALISGFFTKAFTRMMQAFIDRADVLHGKPALPQQASD